MKENMREVTLNSILIQLLKNKKITAGLILIPLLLGMAMGFIKSKGGASSVTPTDKAFLESKTLQFKAYEESNKALAEYIDKSIYLNLNPSSVPAKTYKFYVNPLADEKAISNKSGFFYANSIPSTEDYDAIRNIVGEKIENKFIDDLMPVSYNHETGVLTVKGVYKDSATAGKIADYNYNRILKLHSKFTNSDHTLLELGSLVTNNTDEEIPSKLGVLLQKIDDQKSRMNALKPFVIQNQENTPVSTSKGVVSSMIKWGILGLAGGIALAALFALIKASGSKDVVSIYDFESYTGVPVLGFINGKKLTFRDKLVVGNIADSDKELESILARLSLDLNGKDGNNLLVFGNESVAQNTLSNSVKAKFNNLVPTVINDINTKTIDTLKASDSVILVQQMDEINKDDVRKTAELTKRAGKKVIGMVFTN